MKPVVLALCTFGLALAAGAADKPLLAIPGKVIYESKLDAAPAVPWLMPKGKWELVEGVWRGAEKPEDKHGAVARLPNKLADFVIDYEIKFEGGKASALSINAAKAHMARIAITPQYVSLIRDGSHDGTVKPDIYARFAVNFATGTWHKVHMEMVGDTVLGQVDDLVAWGCSDAFKQGRFGPGLTVGGQSVDFRNLSVREATLNPDWEKVKETLPKPGEKLAALPAPAKKAAAKAVKKAE
jgi:hypothetical protein